MKDIEIPQPDERTGWYRFFEILPGVITYSIYATPFVLTLISPRAAAYFIISYVLIWVFKAVAMSRRVLQGHARIKKARVLDWPQMLKDLERPGKALKRLRKPLNSLDAAHHRNLQRIVKSGGLDMFPSQIVHVIIIATYNEGQEIIHPTIDSVVSSAGYNKKRTAFFLAYEARTGAEKERQSLETIKLYKKHFMHAEAVKHEVKPGEVTGKGANATHCGYRVQEWAQQEGIDPATVVVTVLDADNRPDRNYLASLSYTYCIAHDRKHKSYQPVAMYINNIWDVPAIMRLSAVANTYFHTANSMRLHALRNFSAHAQSLDALIETDFWSVRTIVEDGHQFWRSYIRFDGNHEVLPLYTPIYQDAVLAGNYWQTTKAQFKQIRRWTYGVSDVAYLATKAFRKDSKVPKLDAFFKFNRLLESHVGWATSAPLLLLAGWIPLVLALNLNGERSIVIEQLPVIVGRINTFAIVLLLVTMYIGIATLPKRPSHHPRVKYINFLWQWVLVPVVGIVFNSYASLTSQTRLIFGRYIGDFQVTEKVVKNVSKKQKQSN